MADSVVQFVIKASNTASPEFAKIAGDVKALGVQVTQTTRGDLVNFGQAWGTAGKQAASGATEAAGGFDLLHRAAHHAARGGVEELLGQIPVVGSSLAAAARGLGGFALALGGIVGVGVGVIAFLKNLDESATKGLASIQTLSTAIGTQFQHAVLEAAKVRAQANQDALGVIQATYQQELADAEAVKQEKIAKAREELDQLDIFGRKRTELSQEARAKITAAEAEAASKEIEINARKDASIIELDRKRADFAKELTAKLAAAEAEAEQAVLQGQGREVAAIEAGAARKRTIAEQTYQAELKQIESLQLAKSDAWERERQAYQEKEAALTKISADEAAQRQKSLETATTAAITTLSSLGPAFAKTLQLLSVAQFVQQTQDAVKTFTNLRDAIAAGDQTFAKLGITTEKVDAVIAKLGETMRTALQKGEVPAKSTTAALSALLDKAIKTDGFLANMSDNVADVDAAIRGLLDGSLIRTTRAFDDMGIEIDSLRSGFVDLTQEFILNEARLASWTQSAQTAAEAATRLGDAARDMGTQLGTVPNTVGLPGSPGPTLTFNLPDIGMPWTPAMVWNYITRGRAFQHGGIVPGGSVEPVPIIAHGGEAVGAPDVLVSAFFQAMARLKTTGEPMADRGLQRLAGVQIVIQQAPNQKPEDLAKALVPALRRELARGTL